MPRKRRARLKFPVIVVILLVAIFGLYSAAWFFLSNKQKEILESNALGELLTYENIEVKGYPLNIELHLTSPEVLISSPGREVKLNTGKAVISNCVLAPSQYSLALSDDLYITFDSEDKRQVVFNSPPSINVGYDFSSSQVSSFEYDDQGYQLRSLGDTARTLYAVESNKIHIKNQQTDEKNQEIQVELTSFGGKVENPERGVLQGSPAYDLFKIQHALGKQDFVLDGLYQGPKKINRSSLAQDIKITLNKLLYATEQYKLELGGGLEKNAGDMLPTGKLQIALTHIDKMVRTFFDAAKIMEKQSPEEQTMLSLSSMDPDKTVTSVNGFLQEIATPGKSSDTLELTVARNKNENVKIGKFSFPEVIGIYQKHFVASE